MFSEFLLTELLELVEGNGASGPAGCHSASPLPVPDLVLSPVPMEFFLLFTD
jgi:hypothetical protein